MYLSLSSTPFITTVVTVLFECLSVCAYTASVYLCHLGGFQCQILQITFSQRDKIRFLASESTNCCMFDHQQVENSIGE